MFETLSDRFDGIFSRIRGRGKLTEDDVDDVLREIRLALLEADVNLDVTKNLVGRIRERSVGEELSKAKLKVHGGESQCMRCSIGRRPPRPTLPQKPVNIKPSTP